jgi:hypothetical protein
MAEVRAQGEAGVFYTVQQIAARHPAFTVRTLRHWIFNASPHRVWRQGVPEWISGNGFDMAIVRRGRRIYIDEAALFRWLRQPQAGSTGTLF